MAGFVDFTSPAPSTYGEAFAYFLLETLEHMNLAANIERVSNWRKRPAAEITCMVDLKKALLLANELEKMERQDCVAIETMLKQCGSQASPPVAILSGVFDDFLPGKANDLDHLRSPTTSEFDKRKSQVLRQRHLFVTESGGYLGCGPASILPGDKVFLLEGANVPFILRLRKGGGYELVG